MTCYHLTPDTWYLISDIWQLTYYTWYMTLATLYQYPWPDVVTPDTCITLPIHDYRFYGDLAWLLYCTRHLVLLDSSSPVLLNSCTSELLYSWTLEIGRVMILYSWYYTPFDPRNWLIMNIGCEHTANIVIGQSVIKYSTYTGTGKTDGYRYSFCVYGGHTNVVQLIPKIRPGSHQALPRGVLAPLPPSLTARCAIIPWVHPCGERWHSIPVRAYTMTFGHIVSLGT